MPSKSADAVTKATIEMLMQFKESYREFAGHQEIDAEIYFALPYSSWERGANENANGLLRQYVKKGTDLRKVTDEDIQFAQ